jgi:hypothetical protein
LSLGEETRLKPIEGLAWRSIDDEVFVYQPSGALHIFEGAVAQQVWSDLDKGNSTVSALKKSVLDNFEVEAAEAEKDLMDFLTQLIDLKIVQIDP